MNKAGPFLDEAITIFENFQKQLNYQIMIVR